MTEKLNNKVTWLAASLALAAALTGCQPGAQDQEEGASTASELASQNGLSLLNGLSLTNGLSGNGLSGNGLSGNGLSGNGLLMNALKTGVLTTGTMMNTTDGRSTMSYIVKCALPSGHSITAKDSTGTSYTYPGLIGTAPEWETGTCNTTCQERMSACLLAHVNTSGVHIPIWLDSEGAIGWGQSTDYPYQEGSFFGNIFVNPPKGYFCNGKDFASGTVPGRLGAGQSGAPYSDPFGTPGPCTPSCTASSATTNGVADGYSSCNGYTHVVTVWRNFDVNTKYKITNRVTGKCLGGRWQQHLRRGRDPAAHLWGCDEPAVDHHPDLAEALQGRQCEQRQGPGPDRWQHGGRRLADPVDLHGCGEPAVDVPVDGRQPARLLRGHSVRQDDGDDLAR